MRRFVHPCRGFLAALAFVAGVAAFAQPAATASLEGRVFNAKTGAALRNARVALATPAQEAVTDDFGAYRFSHLPAGPLRLTVSYLGLAPQSVTLTLPAGGSLSRDFELNPPGTVAAPGETIVLDAFTVVTDREMSAQAVALNERRTAPNIKNVVALDEYGDVGDENIGEFMRFLPGVGVNDSGLTASNLTLRGFPSNNSGIQLDGAEIASRNTSRSQSLLDVSLANISRVEVTKVPTPDMPASGLGGAINIISKTGFESRRPVFNYSVYLLLSDTMPLSLDAGPPGHVGELSPGMQQPSFNFSGLLPVNKSLALSFGLARSWRLKPMERDDTSDTQSDWNIVNGFQRQSTWYSLRSLLSTWSGQLGADWKISSRDTLSVTLQERLVSNFIMRSDLVAAYGAGATGNDKFTQGAATGVGTVTQASGTNRETATDTTHVTVRYRHTADRWRLDAFGSWSRNHSILDDIDDGHFDSAPTRVSNLILRGEGIGEDDALIPVRYLATTRTGTPVDIYNGANYSILSATSSQFNVVTQRLNGRLDLTRDFTGRVPVTLKVGTFVDRQEKNQRTFNQTWSFNPNGLTTDAARLAGNFDVFDRDFNASAPAIFGRPMGWVSLKKIYELYRAQPSWFVLDEALAHQNRVTNSRLFHETVSAAYLRADTRLLHNRLWLVGGVRFEHTADEGRGALNDPSAQYQKDAAGNLVLNASRQPILLTTDALARARLRYVERGAHAERTYQDFYPSLNATYHLTDNLLIRAGYARTIGRPDITLITPGSTLSEPTVANPTITVNNTGLKPWTADGYDLSLETYQIKGGFGAIGVFQKNISDFFGSITTAATPELLALYGLPSDPLYLNYNVTTRTNAGDARITGVEFTYTQALTFLPHWARGFQVSFNSTKLSVHGSNTADFDGFAPSNLAGSLNFVRPRFSIKLTCTHQGETRTGAVAVSTANGIPAGTYSYQGARTRWGLNAQYSFSKRFAVYGSMTDIDGGMTTRTYRYAPGTPEFAKSVRRQELGSAITLGLRGTF